MRAITVCVEYGDLLALTLPHNRHHFESVMVVTTPTDEETIEVAHRNQAQVFLTNAFYDDGALFNKWKALEKGLSEFGRKGLLAIIDADIMWPSNVPGTGYQFGNLYSPHRVMWAHPNIPVPPEDQWGGSMAMGDREWAGYTQIFWATDPHLPDSPPWHETDWIHAGGADSAFQNLWPARHKIRPDWKVLHLGLPMRNWAGRTTQRIDGEQPPQARDRALAFREILHQRAVTGGYGAERLPLGARSNARAERGRVPRGGPGQ